MPIVESKNHSAIADRDFERNRRSWHAPHAVSECDPLLERWKTKVHFLDAAPGRLAGRRVRIVGARDLVEHQKRRVGAFILLLPVRALQVRLQGGGAGKLVGGSLRGRNRYDARTVLLPL